MRSLLNAVSVCFADGRRFALGIVCNDLVQTHLNFIVSPSVPYIPTTHNIH